VPHGQSAGGLGSLRLALCGTEICYERGQQKHVIACTYAQLHYQLRRMRPQDALIAERTLEGGTPYEMSLDDADIYRRALTSPLTP